MVVVFRRFIQEVMQKKQQPMNEIKSLLIVSKTNRIVCQQKVK